MRLYRSKIRICDKIYKAVRHLQLLDKLASEAGLLRS